MRVTIAAGGLVALAALGACSPTGGMDAEFEAIVATDSLNQAVSLGSAQVDAQPGLEMLITLGITNKTEHWIDFPPGYGATGYVWSEATGKWEEIPNRVVFSENARLLGPAGGDDPSGGVVTYSPGSLWPDSSFIRVTVRGSVQNDDGTAGEEVGAYIDVLRPE